MSTTAADRGWGAAGAPGSAAAAKYRKDHIVTIDVGGVRLSVRREVAPLFAGFIMEIVQGGYDLTRRADDWGYASRYVRGYETQKILSNHAWGLAIDLNAATNPMTSDGIVHTDMPSWVIAAANHWGLTWGGDYKSRRKDPMHFEFTGTPADAANLVVSISPPTQQHEPEDDLMRDERIVTVPADRSFTFIDENSRPLGVYTKTSSVDLLASNTGRVTPLIVQWFRSDGPTWQDALAVAFANLDGTPAPPGAKARIVIEHR